MVENEKKQQSLRNADFKIGVVLLIVTIAIIVETLSFPMQGSYGGVESQWYVSPALFPLLIASVLLLSTIVLLTTAIKAKGHQQFLSLKGWFGSMKDTVNIDRWYVIFQLIVYIYIFIPNADFYLSTVVFLCAITFRFYINAPRMIAALLMTQLITIISFFVLRAILLDEFYWFSLQPVADESLLKWSDRLLMLNSFVNGVLLFTLYKPSKKIAVYLFVTCLLAPLILVFVFSLFLYIPMPVEYGTVSEGLQILWYDILNI